MVDQLGLQLDQITEFRSVFGIGQVRVAADGAGGGAWRIQQNGVECALHGARVLGQRLGLQPDAGEVFLHPLHPGVRLVDGGDDRPRGGQLHRLAARRGAEVQHRLALLRGQHPHRDRGGGILHPPVALGKARHGRDLPGIRHPNRACRQQCAPHGLCQSGGIALGGQIKRCAREMRLFHRGHGIGAPSLGQRSAQPFRQARRAQGIPRLGPLSGDLAQHGVGQPLEMAQRAVLRDEVHHRVHHPMRGPALTKLDRADPQHIAHGQRRCLLQVLLQQPVRPFQPAQRVLRQTLRPRPIIGGQLVQRARGKKLGHQSRLIAQNLIQQINRASAGLNACVCHGHILSGSGLRGCRVVWASGRRISRENLAQEDHDARSTPHSRQQTRP